MTPTCSKICSLFSLIKRILCKCNIFPISMIHISNVGSASDFQCGKIRQHAESNSLYQPRFCCHHTKQCHTRIWCNSSVLYLRKMTKQQVPEMIEPVTCDELWLCLFCSRTLWTQRWYLWRELTLAQMKSVNDLKLNPTQTGIYQTIMNIVNAGFDISVPSSSSQHCLNASERVGLKRLDICHHISTTCWGFCS